MKGEKGTMRTRRWRFAPIGMVVALALLAAACGGGGAGSGSGSEGGSSGASEPVKGGVVTIARTDESDTLDPAHTVAGPSSIVFHYIYDTLVTKTPKGDFEGDLATDWETSPDGKTWTFHLRQGVVFSNGDPFNADAVVFTFQRILDPATKAPSKGFLGPVAKVEKVDDYTVRFELSQPSALLLDNLAINYFGIVDPKAVQAEGDKYGRNPVGTGPFMLKEWVTGDHITLVPNPRHKEFRSYIKNKGTPYISQLVFRTIPNVETQLAAMQSGQANVVLGLPGDKAAQYKDTPGFRVVTNEHSTDVAYLSFGMTKAASGDNPFVPPFDDIRVRQAVGYAIDAPGIIKSVLNDYAVRNCTPMPPGDFGYDKSLGDSYCYKADPTKAGQLLDAAGWKMGANGVREKDGKPLAVHFWVLDSQKNVAQVIQSELEAVGFKVDITSLDVGTYTARVTKSDMNLELIDVGWPSPNILDVMTTLGWGFGLYNHNGLQQALATAATTLDADARREAYAKAQKIILDDAAIIPIYSSEGTTLISSKVRDFTIDPAGAPDFSDAWVQP